MILTLNTFTLELTLHAARHGHWVPLPLQPSGHTLSATTDHLTCHLRLTPQSDDRLAFHLSFTSHYPTRLRLRAQLLDQDSIQLFHLIPGNIHGDNNAPHVRPGEFPVLATDRLHERNRAPLWEFRADRASHPVSILTCPTGAVAISIDPYADCPQAEDGFLRNGLFAALPDAFGVSLGYGNDPLTFVEKTHFRPATADLSHGASGSGLLIAARGNGRPAAHAILRSLYPTLRSLPTYRKTHSAALRALATTFAAVNYCPELHQYTNRRCHVPTDTTLRPWRAITEIGWTGGSMLAYPFTLAQHLYPELDFPKPPKQIFDEICTGFNERSGFINDTAINRFTKNIPQGWNTSQINGWWSGFLPQTQNNHCAYTNAHAAYYLLKTTLFLKQRGQESFPHWPRTALKVLDTAIALQRHDGAFGYLFSSTERKVLDHDGFAGCWFAAALPLAAALTGNSKYLDPAARALAYYHPFVKALAAWGTPMDTYKSIDSEGNLAFLRAARLMHHQTHDDRYLTMLTDAANYEYLWRYAYQTRPQAPPLKGSSWNSCGGSITSVSNPHIHPMSTVATPDLEYLARVTNDPYHQHRADDGLAWLMNTMELYPDITGYGQYGVLSERTCPSDGLLVETYADTHSPASTWWSYNAWAAASAMEALAEQLLAHPPEPQ